MSRHSAKGFPDKEVAVEVLNTEAAPRYMGITVTGVKVAESPEWLQNRLRSIGAESAQQHRRHYKFHPARGWPAVARIRCRQDQRRQSDRPHVPEGTPFVTLDGVERKLSDKDLMICDTEKPMCIAGVFGGLDSGVTETTTDVFIESAYFNPVWIRKSAKRHGFEHRCLVPFRTRDRSGDSALCVETGSPTDGGIGGRKGQLPGNGPLSRSGATFPVRHFAQPRQTTDGQRCAG